jgi:amidophosphoribosyltransferase
MFGHSAYEIRKRCGRLLAEQIPAEADLVVPVPDSGIAAALGYAHASGLPFELGIVRNHYVGRTFIRPAQDIRDFGVKVKLNPVKSVIKGKRLVVVDDSIVRGTTCRQIVHMLKEIGAKEVHMRIASPPIFFPCRYGIDVPSKDDLIANRFPPDGIQNYIDADSLGFISLEDLINAVGGSNYCYACFSGDYPLKEL